MIVDVQRIPQVALAFINDDHREEGRLLNELAQAVRQHRDGKAPVEAVLHRWEALFLHTQAHFGREEKAMQEAAFPPYPLHKAEHDRVLEEMDVEGEHFRETGDTARLRAYVTEGVPAWFIQHIQSMDAVTAQFVAMRQGG
jgi:hemerythrin